jgi:hypothetical protein
LWKAIHNNGCCFPHHLTRKSNSKSWGKCSAMDGMSDR